EVDENEFEITERYVTQESWETIFFDLKNKFGKDDTYWAIVNNNADEIAPAKASIAEHLADIYQDMKDFIMLYQKGTIASKENSVAECRYLFETHWGSRLTNAHRALHNIVYKENVQNNDFYESEN
ncbi:MAG: DUF5063 domain-containing protein, partial [Bacteroidetes bacterium]|nr:DUF5063 domain-containing protein [Bacteroidota bacterium]